MRRSAAEPARTTTQDGYCSVRVKPRPDVLARRPPRDQSRRKRAVDAESQNLALHRLAASSHEPGMRQTLQAGQTPAASCSSRSLSAPPAGAEQAARQKARAVADLQKLFFEEVARGKGTNEAAADALRRLRDQSMAPGSRAATPVLEEDEEESSRVSDSHRGERQDCSDPAPQLADDMEAEAESTPEPSAPMRPSAPKNRPARRRPAPRCVAVCS